jgi:photosystem II stability/assembly factor-like uncharacterized protein
MRVLSLSLSLGLLALGCERVTTTTPAAGAAAGSGWTTIAAGTANLNAVSGLSDSAVWVVGDRGTIGYYNGRSLAFEASGTSVDLRGVWAVDATHVYAVGDQGTILQRGVAGWKQVGAGVTPQVLTSVYADAQRVVAVGSGGTIVLGTPSGAAMTFALVTSPNTENLLGVSGSPGGPVTAVGALGNVVSINGGSATRTPIPAFSQLLAGSATGAAATYLVGQLGTVYRADGAGLNPVTGCPLSALRAVSMVGSVAWIVGWDGAICEINGASVASYPYSDARWFNGVYAASTTSLWIVGASGTFLHGFPKGATP